MSVICDYAMIDLPENWRWMVGAPAVLAAVQVWIVLVAPRSPYFLIDRELNDEARDVLGKLYLGGPEVVEVRTRPCACALVRALVRLCMRACVRARVCLCVCACVLGRVCAVCVGGGGGEGGCNWIVAVPFRRFAILLPPLQRG